TCETTKLHAKVEAVRKAGTVRLAGERPVRFRPADVAFHMRETLPFHPNGLTFTANLGEGAEHAETYYSVGGGFVVQEDAVADAGHLAPPPFPIGSAEELLRHCREEGVSIAELVRSNELTWR